MNDDLEKWLEKDGERFLRAIGLRRGQVVLDFGCGKGRYTIPAAKVVGNKGKVYAMDKDKKALNKLIRSAKKINNIEFINNNSAVSLEDNCVNVVLCYDVIHYAKKRKAIYDEIRRVLKPGGLFSVYPKHNKNDDPLDGLANVELKDIIAEIRQSGFRLKNRFFKRCFHDESYDKGYILNFRK